MEPVAFLPQRVWEVTTVALAAYLVSFGILGLIKGRAAGARWMSRRAVRMAAALETLPGVGIGIAGFLTNSEPPCSRCGQGAWGGTTMLVAMSIWLPPLAPRLEPPVRVALSAGPGCDTRANKSATLSLELHFVPGDVESGARFTAGGTVICVQNDRRYWPCAVKQRPCRRSR